MKQKKSGLKDALKDLGITLGFFWSLPHTIFGFLLMALPAWPKQWSLKRWEGFDWFPYFPRKIRWCWANWGGFVLEAIPKRLIPKGWDQTGDGDIDDLADFRTGAQTHGWIIFYRDYAAARHPLLREHEETHVLQGYIGGVFYVLAYAFSSLVMLISGKHYYHDNWFEKHANRRELRLAKQLEFTEKNNGEEGSNG
jgi:hypothetical protein